VAVDAVVYYRISNPWISVINVENAARSTQLLAQTTLRNILGTKTLSEILTDRESISAMMQVTLFTDHFSGPGDAIGRMCGQSLSNEMTFDLLDI